VYIVIDKIFTEAERYREKSDGKGNDVVYRRPVFDVLCRILKLIDCLRFYFSLKNIYGYVSITSEGPQNLGLCSALRAFEQGRIFIVPHLL
jgi:hypothetical protein